MRRAVAHAARLKRSLCSVKSSAVQQSSRSIGSLEYGPDGIFRLFTSGQLLSSRLCMRRAAWPTDGTH